jgi:hypothetical protein
LEVLERDFFTPGVRKDGVERDFASDELVELESGGDA